MTHFIYSFSTEFIPSISSHSVYFFDFPHLTLFIRLSSGSVRTVDQLDPACRGSLDPSAVNAVLYQTNPKAGASIHSQLGWKSVLSRNDDLASSDPKMVQQMANLDMMFSKSTAWAHEQVTTTPLVLVGSMYYPSDNK